MRWAVLFTVMLASCAICMPVTAVPIPHGINITGGAPPAPPSITISANPSDVPIGETVILNGTVTGINTIAVYLFVTGPGLDPRGVSLENLNIAAGHGLFTTAPVMMSDGSWTYTWDTSIIVGNLKPGTYSVFVVGSPLDRIRSNPQETAVAQVNFTPSIDKEVETPLPAVLPFAALVLAVALFGAVARKRD